MLIKQIYTYKDGKLDYAFNTAQHFENYVFNHIVNEKEKANMKHLIKIVDRIPLNNGLPDELNRVVYLAERAKEHGYKVSIVLEL